MNKWLRTFTREVEVTTPGLGHGVASCEALDRVGLGLVARER